MIGIDITKISRFQSMSRLDKFIELLNVDGDTPMAVAKTWACIEALVKANGSSFKYSKIKIKFPTGMPPQIEDPENTLNGKYYLSLSHEDDMVIAVAVKTEIFK